MASGNSADYHIRLRNLFLNPPKASDSNVPWYDYKPTLKDDFTKPHKFHNKDPELYYVPIRSAFESFITNFKKLVNFKGSPIPLIAIHGTPGIGKSAFLDQLADALWYLKNPNNKKPELLDKIPDLFEKNSDWLRQYVVVCVTYNYLSPINNYEDELSDSERFSIRILWSYFFTQSTDYENFCKCFIPLIRQQVGSLPQLIDAICVLKSTYAQNTKPKVPEKDVKILVLLDETLMFRGKDSSKNEEQRSKDTNEAVGFASKICTPMDHRIGYYLLLTSIDEILYGGIKTGSGRTASWVKLCTLDSVQWDEYFAPLRKRISEEENENRRTEMERLLSRCAIEANGLPRALFKIYNQLKIIFDEANSNLTHYPILEEIVNSTDILKIPSINAETLALGLLGEHVNPDNRKISRTSARLDRPSVSSLVGSGVYVHSSLGSDSIVPRLTGLHVRHALHDHNTFGSREQDFLSELLSDLPIDAPARQSLNILHSLLTELLRIEPHFDSSDCGQIFEEFHCLIELMKQHLRLICWSYEKLTSRIERGTLVNASLSEHYHLSHLPTEKGPFWLISNSGKPFTNKPQTPEHSTVLQWPLLSCEPNFQVNKEPTKPEDIDDLESTPLNHYLIQEGAKCTSSPFETLQNFVKDAVEKENAGKHWSMPLIRSETQGFPGYDASLLVRKKPNPGARGEVWCILIECKHSQRKQSSDAAATNTAAVVTAQPDEASAAAAQPNNASSSPHLQAIRGLDLSTLNKKLQAIRESKYVTELRELGVKRVIYVVAAWKELEDDLNNVKLSELNNWSKEDVKILTVLLLGRSQLADFYSPSLVPYASYFADPR